MASVDVGCPRGDGCYQLTFVIVDMVVVVVFALLIVFLGAGGVSELVWAALVVTWCYQLTSAIVAAVLMVIEGGGRIPGLRYLQ